MKKVSVVRAEEATVKPFDLKAFVMPPIQKESLNPVTKKEVKEMAEALGLSYDHAQIVFTRKVMNAYIKKEI